MRKLVVLMLCLFAASLLLAQGFDPASRLQEARERALAVRAARMDALRQLGEAIKGVRIDSRTTVKDFVVESDEITARFEGFLQGAQQEGKPNVYDDGTVEIKMVIESNKLVQELSQMSRRFADAITTAAQ